MAAQVGGVSSAPDTLDAQIDAQTTDPYVRQALRFGALLEGGGLSGPWNAGDSGTSFGPYQIHLPAHPGVSAEQANDPGFAVGYMLAPYTNAVAATHGQPWGVTSAEQAVRAAERPAESYWQSHGATSVQADWTQAIAGNPAGTGDPSTQGVPDVPPTTGTATTHTSGGGGSGLSWSDLNPLNWGSDLAGGIGKGLSSGISSLFAPIEDFLIRAFLVVAGLALLFLAIHLLGEARDLDAGVAPPSDTSDARSDAKEGAEAAAAGE